MRRPGDGRAKMSQKQWRQLVSLFALDLDATAIAKALGCSRNTVNSHLHALRGRIQAHCRERQPLLGRMQAGDVFFQVGLVKGPSRTPRREPAALLGVVRRQGPLVMELAPDQEENALRLIRHSRFWLEMHGKADGCPLAWRRREEVVDRDQLLARSPALGLVPDEENAARDQVVRFLHFAMARLEKFRGMHLHMLRLHLKETEFRFNHPGMSFYAALRDIL